VLVACFLVAVTHARDWRLASTEYGLVEGETFELHDGSRVSRWHGIPYAKPITGENRFNEPVKPDKWDGVRKAHRLPTACPQPPAGVVWITNPLWGKFDEDCLYLNIFAPEDTSRGPYPVMFYIHGGGFATSSSIQYPGHFLAAHDVVVVVINYRLGSLGFMSTGDETVPGNMGLLDQTLALEFVRDNIANFGGDPNQVTLFGQSAGAASSSLHMYIPRSQGLFHQVIAQSGSEHAAWAVNVPGEVPERYTQKVAADNGCPTEPSRAMMDCLRTLDQSIFSTPGVDCTPGYFCLGFVPVVDGNTIKDEPIKMRRRGEFAKVKLMAGQTSDDGSLYTVALVPESVLGGFNRSSFIRNLREQLLDLFLPLHPERYEEALKAMDFYYSDWPALDDLDRNREVFNKIITDFGFGTNGDVQIKDQSRYTDVYHYVLGYRTTKADMFVPQWMGVPHQGDLPYMTGWPLLQLNPEVRWDAAIPIDFIQWDAEDIDWAVYILKLWTNFAKYGDPSPVPVPTPNGNPDTTWPRFNTESYKYLYMDRKTEVRTEYRQRNFAFWHQYFPYITDGKLFPAGEPVVRPEEAEGGWKTWRDKRSTPASGKGFNAQNFQNNIDSWYHQLAENAMKQFGGALFQ